MVIEVEVRVRGEEMRTTDFTLENVMGWWQPWMIWQERSWVCKKSSHTWCRAFPRKSRREGANPLRAMQIFPPQLRGHRGMEKLPASGGRFFRWISLRRRWRQSPEAMGQRTCCLWWPLCALGRSRASCFALLILRSREMLILWT